MLWSAGLLAVAAVLVLAACANDDPRVAEPRETELAISVRAAPGAPAQRYELRCDPPRGTHPDPAAACAVARRSGPETFAPVPGDVACTQIYGGPQTARVEGTLGGEPVAASLSRENGCEIDRWEALRPLVPLPAEPS